MMMMMMIMMMLMMMMIIIIIIVIITGDIGTINSNDRIAATVYSVGTWFVSGIFVKIPCRKQPKMMMMMMMMMIIIIIIIMCMQLLYESTYCYQGAM
jgi:hypothetical protein